MFSIAVNTRYKYKFSTARALSKARRKYFVYLPVLTKAPSFQQLYNACSSIKRKKTRDLLNTF